MKKKTIVLIVIFGLILSCNSIKNTIPFEKTIFTFLDKNSINILESSTHKDLGLNPSLNEINIYITETNYLDNQKITTYDIVGSIGRTYNDEFQPDDYKILDYKKYTINVFYNFLKKTKKKFNIIYLDENEIYEIYNDESDGWIIVKCSDEVSKIIYTPTFYTDKSGFVRVKELDNFQCK